MKILITRQESLTHDLVKRLAALHVNSVIFPLFAVESKLDKVSLQKLTVNLQSASLGVFISRNAAELVVPHLAPINGVCWASVGPATAEYLQTLGLWRIIYPQQPPFDSQGLIKQLKLANVDLINKQVLLFTGENGNNWLANEFAQLGAIVKIIEVYKRVLPAVTVTELEKVFKSRPKIDLILITCVTSLINLQLLTARIGVGIFNTPLLVVSNRIHEAALDMGFVTVYNSNGMTDAEIFSAVCELT